MRGPLIGGKDFKASIGQKKNLKERSWRLTKEERNILCGKKRKRGE